MATNPFQPPQAMVGDPSGTDVAVPPPWFQVLFVAILFATHVAIFGNYFGIYYELVRTGAIHPLGPLVGLFSDGVMLVGIVLMGRLPVGREMVLLTYFFGAVVAFYGGWVAYHHARRRV
jgi:hypothetical protein